MKKPPETWFWSHDIKPTQIDSVVMPGTRLMRLSSYGQGERRRFAALLYQDPGPERSYALDLDAAALAARLRDTGARAVAITAGGAVAGGDARFSVVLETGPGPLSSVHVDLDEAGVRGLLDDQHCIADLATYTAGGARRFAAIVEERLGPSWLFLGVSAQELDRELLALGATLVRLRSYVERSETGGSAPRGIDAGLPRLAAVAERARAGSWAWYADLDADGVARNLEGNAAYPVDLDATDHSRGIPGAEPPGVRFTVVMYRDR